MDCDHWGEGETDWHRWWKRHAPTSRCEVTMGNHRADIVSPRGTVVELQHSPIAPTVIREREAFYDFMVWVFDAGEFAERITERRPGFFVWKHARASILSTSKPTYLDMGDVLLRINRVLPVKYRDWAFDSLTGRRFGVSPLPRAFTGMWIDHDQFIERFIADNPSVPAVAAFSSEQLPLFGTGR